MDSLGRVIEKLQDNCHEARKYQELYQRMQMSIGCDSSNRQESAMKLVTNSDRQTFIVEGARRLYMLRVNYEIKRLELEVDREQTCHGRTEKLVAAAERKFAQLSGGSSDQIRSLRKSSRSYLALSKRANGLGILLMLGCSTRDL